MLHRITSRRQMQRQKHTLELRAVFTCQDISTMSGMNTKNTVVTLDCTVSNLHLTVQHFDADGQNIQPVNVSLTQLQEGHCY